MQVAFGTGAGACSYFGGGEGQWILGRVAGSTRRSRKHGSILIRERGSIASTSRYYQVKPKLEPSCPLATIVNCRTASRVRRIDREPLVEASEMTLSDNRNRAGNVVRIPEYRFH